MTFDITTIQRSLRREVRAVAGPEVLRCVELRSSMKHIQLTLAVLFIVPNINLYRVHPSWGSGRVPQY